MAETVVDGLEMVQVKHDECYWRAVAQLDGGLALQLLKHIAAAVGSRELVMGDELVQARHRVIELCIFGFDFFMADGELAAGLGEQPHQSDIAHGAVQVAHQFTLEGTGVPELHGKHHHPAHADLQSDGVVHHRKLHQRGKQQARREYQRGIPYRRHHHHANARHTDQHAEVGEVEKKLPVHPDEPHRAAPTQPHQPRTRNVPLFQPPGGRVAVQAEAKPVAHPERPEFNDGHQGHPDQRRLQVLDGHNQPGHQANAQGGRVRTVHQPLAKYARLLHANLARNQCFVKLQRSCRVHCCFSPWRNSRTNPDRPDSPSYPD